MMSHLDDIEQNKERADYFKWKLEQDTTFFVRSFYKDAEKSLMVEHWVMFGEGELYALQVIWKTDMAKRLI